MGRQLRYNLVHVHVAETLHWRQKERGQKGRFQRWQKGGEIEEILHHHINYILSNKNNIRRGGEVQEVQMFTPHWARIC